MWEQEVQSRRDQAVDRLCRLKTKTVICNGGRTHKESNKEPVGMTEHYTGYCL
jgi:hypothetical protein